MLSDEQVLEILALHEVGCDVFEISRITRCELWDVIGAIAADESEFPDEPLRRVLH